VAEFVGGDVVVVPFPFTDLQSSKRRPAVVLATFARGDLLICQITSRSDLHPGAVSIGIDDFIRGGIDRTSVALPHRLVTVHEAIILRSAGTLALSKLTELVERVCAVIRAGREPAP
jgi:mRNA interferase MazF